MIRSEMEQVMREIKENSRRLKGCKMHNFTMDSTPNRDYSKRYRCTNCGGEVANGDKIWYELGLSHAKNE